jgi:hypothetical protein
MTRPRLALLAGAFALVAGPAKACLEIVTKQSEARAFEHAEAVVRVEALTESYVPVPGTPSLRVGVGTGRIIETLKGRVAKGAIINYRIVDGDGSDMSCPARRFARPGGVYKLYLKGAPDWGPPIILLPTD